MTPTQKINTLRERINKHCPHLMELRFGCEVVENSEEPSPKREIKRVLDIRHVNPSSEYRSGSIVELQKPNTNGVSLVFYKDKLDLKILGIPPTLQDVLMAIRKCRSNRTLRFDGLNVKMLWIGKAGHEDEVLYNLTKPLAEQSEETLDFLLSVIK